MNPYELVAALAAAQARIIIEEMELHGLHQAVAEATARYNSHQQELSRLVGMASSVAAAYPGKIITLHAVPGSSGEYTAAITPEENHDLS